MSELPTKIGRYEITQELGRGGMAVVYLAQDPLMGRQVAVKVLPRQFTFEPQFQRRFHEEAQMIATLEDPAIVPVYDFGEEGDQPYLVMRHMTGGTLRERLRQGPLPIAEVERILARLAPALDKAHQVGIIHRDLKPDNVLFDADDRGYLADFGIARLAEATRTMTIIGTPAYMSPEQWEGAGALDSRSDIYALGAILFEMLTGQPPYEADTPASLMRSHLMAPVPQLAQANPRLSAAYQDVIDGAMAKKREGRTATAAALLAAFRAAGRAKEAPEVKGGMEPEAAFESMLGSMMEESKLAPERLITDYGEEPVLAPTEVIDHGLEPPLVRELPAPRPSPALPWWRRLPRWSWALLALPLLALGMWGVSQMGGSGTDTREPEPTGTEVVAARAPTESVSPAATATSRPRPTETATRMPTATQMPTATSTATSTPTVDPNVPPPNPALGDRWTRPADGMVMVYVPGGMFMMGSDPDEDPLAADDEFPQHRVTLDSFWLDRTEVTNGKYEQCVAEDDCAGSIYADNPDLNGPVQPVVGVDWFNADAYCQWAGGQLPTEAQWEYAARGSDGRIYPWGRASPTCELAQYGNCSGRTTPVGNFSPAEDSWAGAADMAGNVWEWVADWYDSDYYESSPANNPMGPAEGDVKVLRGGSWNGDARNLRAAHRYDVAPGLRFNVFGFRCAAPGE